MFLINFFFLISCGQLNAGNSIFSRMKEWIIKPEHFSRYRLYDGLLDKYPAELDRELIHDILASDDYYLDLIEESILKREHNGPKADKTISISKVANGLAEVTLPAILYYMVKNYYCDQCAQEYKVPALLIGGVFASLGLHNIYKGIRYKKRMTEKLARDKEVRRLLRELTDQI